MISYSEIPEKTFFLSGFALIPCFLTHFPSFPIRFFYSNLISFSLQYNKLKFSESFIIRNELPCGMRCTTVHIDFLGAASDIFGGCLLSFPRPVLRLRYNKVVYIYLAGCGAGSYACSIIIPEQIDVIGIRFQRNGQLCPGITFELCGGFA